MSGDAHSEAPPVSTENPPADSSLHLALEHLQLSRSVNAALRSRNLVTLSDVLRFVQSDTFSDFSFRPEVTAAIRVLSAATKGDATDWQSYWKLSGEVVHHLAADLPELRVLSEAARAYPVNRDTFGNAGAMLQRAGFETLGLLADGLRVGIPEVRGMGPAKVQEFFGYLNALVEKIRSEGEGSVLKKDHTESDEGLPDLPPDVSALPVTVLHIGTKSHHLRNAGIRTLGQLAEVWPLRYRDHHGLGPTTLSLLRERMDALLAALTPAGGVDWETYCATCRIPLVPSLSRPSTGREFLTILPDVIAEIADRLPDRAQADILRSRLAKAAGERKSLEEIALACDPPVTRERVRQKETTLLRQIAGGVIWDSYGNLGIHFHPTFTHWWRLAADQFRETHDIEFNDFVSKLASAWSVDVPAVMSELPFILSVVTGEPGTPPGFRSAIRIPPVFYGDIRQEVRQLKWSSLRIGRSARLLADLGLETVGDFVDSCCSGTIADIENAATRAARHHLDILAGCLDEEGLLDWQAYRLALGLRILPEDITPDRSQFLENLPIVVGDMLKLLATTGRAAEIFGLRTSWPAHARMTLDRTARQLNSHGPSVKREETVFLQQLNDVIFGKDFAQASFWINGDWLGFWLEAAAVYSEASEGYEQFEKALADNWRVAGAERGVAVLWAVLTGYPEGRPAAVRKPRMVSASSHEPVVGRIRLSGFRQVH